MSTIDPIQLAQIDKTKPLRIGETSRATTCALCGGPIGGNCTDWTVSVPGHGKAHPGCAEDAGWRVDA